MVIHEKKHMGLVCGDMYTGTEPKVLSARTTNRKAKRERTKEGYHQPEIHGKRVGGHEACVDDGRI